MSKLCKDCKYFKILYHPIRAEGGGYYDSGLAVCRKHNLEVDFLSKGKFKTLTCVEDESQTDMRGKDMVYSVVVCGSLVTEQLAFRGKIYTKSWDHGTDGLVSKDKSFSEQLGKNKVEDYICKKIEHVIDAANLAAELQKLEAEGIEENVQ